MPPQVARSGHAFTRATTDFPRSFIRRSALADPPACGIAMALQVRVDGQALQFCSAGYVLEIGKMRLPLPGWLTPGALTVTHADLGGDQFRFTLEIIHPRFGRLIRQSAVFREATS